MDLGLAGKSCVVTGASRGIGLEASRMLAAEGASVLLVARGLEQLERASETCIDAASTCESGATTSDGAQSGAVATPEKRIAVLTLDVTDEDAGERILTEAETRFGSLDVLVNNAGFAHWRQLEQISDEDWRQQFEVNVMAPMRAMRAAAPHMAERGWGRIVNVTSTSGKRPSAWTPDYSAAKAAQLSLSRWFADRYAKQGVLINAVSPGPALSAMWTESGGLADQAVKLTGAASREAAIEAVGAARPIGRLATAEEIAAAIVFLCSERASYVAGAAWAVDGGTIPVII